MNSTTPWSLTTLTAAGQLALTACAETEHPSDPEIDGEHPAQESPRIHSEEADLWVRAAQSGMTSLFGTIENLTGEDLEIVAAESSASEIVELHEIVLDEDGDPMMQEIEGGFQIPQTEP